MMFCDCLSAIVHVYPPTHVKGTPFETPDQGKARLLDPLGTDGLRGPVHRLSKFLTITPIIL